MELSPNLHIKSLPSADWWEMLQPLTCTGGPEITVPVGFQTDLASIPRLLRWRFKVTGKSRRAAVLHDYLYHTKWRTRKECDQVFKSALRVCGMSVYDAWVMYQAVRVGGWTRGNW